MIICNNNKFCLNVFPKVTVPHKAILSILHLVSPFCQRPVCRSPLLPVLSPVAGWGSGDDSRILVILAEQDFLKCLTKHLIEYSVENRIDHGASIPQPRDYVEDPQRNFFFTSLANRWKQIKNEERCPKDDESEKDYPQNFGGLLLQSDNSSMSWTISNRRVSGMMRPNGLVSLKRERRVFPTT